MYNSNWAGASSQWPCAVKSNSQLAENYTKTKKHKIKRRLKWRQKKNTVGQSKVDFHAKSFLWKSLGVRISALRMSGSGPSRGVRGEVGEVGGFFRRWACQTPAIIVTKRSGPCNFLAWSTHWDSKMEIQTRIHIWIWIQFEIQIAQRNRRRCELFHGYWDFYAPCCRRRGRGMR